MSATITREVPSTSFIAQRKARVAEITAKHSQNPFGHYDASKSEIRAEAIRRNLETVFSK